MGAVVAKIAFAQAGTASDEIAQVIKELRANDFTGALSLSERACERAPQDVRVWTLRALALSGLKREESALGAYEHALTLSPEYLPALKGAGETAFHLHDRSAAGILDRLVQLQPSDLTAQAMLGELDLRAGDCRGADTHLSRAGNLIASQMEILEGYSRCLVSLGEFSKAAFVFDQWAALVPSAEEPRYDSALALIKLERWQEALTRLEPLLAIENPGEDTLTLAALAYEQQGNTKYAVELLRRAIALHPHDQDAYLEFVNLAYRHESVPVALEMVTLGVQQNPKSAELHFARGVLLCGLGRTIEGLPELDEANQLNPGLTALSVATGIAQSQIQHSDEAVAEFRHATVEHSGDSLAWYLLAEALTQSKFATDPTISAELEHAGRRALELKPDQTAAYDLMASFYVRVDRPAEAAEMCEQALKRDPTDIQALYRLVLLTRKSGDKGKLDGLVQRLVQARSQESRRAEAARVQRLSISPINASGPRNEPQNP